MSVYPSCSRVRWCHLFASSSARDASLVQRHARITPGRRGSPGTGGTAGRTCDARHNRGMARSGRV